MVIGFMILYNYVYRTFNYKRGVKQIETPNPEKK